MKTTTRFTMTLAILTMATTSAVFGQFPEDGYLSRSRTIRPAAGSVANDFPELPASLSEYSNRRTTANPPADPFRTPVNDYRDPRSLGGEQIRYRVPLDNGYDNLPADLFDSGNRVRGDYRRDGTNCRDDFSREEASGPAYAPIDDRYDRRRYAPVNDSNYDRNYPPVNDRGYDRNYAPVNDRNYDGNYDPTYDRSPARPVIDRYAPREAQDPFIPAPLPTDRIDDEAAKINELITIRYQNPVTVRAIRAMSDAQAVSLFSEVSQKIDERSLEPTSYDVRVRRGLRNLSMALDNPAFVNGLGLSGDSFQMDGFRNTLARLAGAGQVRNYQEARTVLNTVMSQASSVRGLTPSVVGFEFANASIDTLDKFSGLEPADPASRNGAEMSGLKSAALEEEIVGVGVEVREHAEGLLVVKPLRGGPAAEAGIETGDIILSINGREIAGMKMASSVDLMKGSAGSQMKVRIYRDGRGERDFVMTRRTVRVWTVNDAKLLSGTDVGYFSLSRFSQSSTAELDQTLNSLYSKGMKSLIIDLRGNPGGLLTTCVEISDRFVACGTIVSTKGRLSGDNMLEKATYSKTWSMPLVVLVDGDSASASEIFAAAVQENRRGVVVGTKSYGKGSVQTHFPLNAIGGDLRLTTALFYSPTGRKMAGEGVTPDIEVIDRDGVANGDEVLVEALRVARSQTLKDMAKASGVCRPQLPSAGRSSSLSNIVDPSHIGTRVR